MEARFCVLTCSVLNCCLTDSLMLLLLLILTIGFSRIYLRVHYASDVIAGFCVGLLWLVICVAVLNKLEKFYVARSIGFLQEMTSLPLDLYTLQDMIVGNPVYLDSNIIRYSTGNGVVNLLSLGQFFKNLLTLNDGDKSVIHSKLDDTNPMRSRTANHVNATTPTSLPRTSPTTTP